MQSTCFTNILSVIHQEITTLCHEKMRVKLAQQEFRHCVRDERHEAWDMELKAIEERTKILVERRKTILRKNLVLS